MNLSRTILATALLASSWSAQAQAWSDLYQKATEALREERWVEARNLFKEAASRRAEDFSGPTLLNRPGQPERVWRNGASYSPNFGAAYAGYRLALKLTEEAERTALLKEVAAEFQTLIGKEQHSRATFYFLGNILALLGDKDGQQNLTTKEREIGSGMTWKIDEELLTAEERAQISGVAIVPETKPEVKPETKPEVKPEEKPADKPKDEPENKPEDKPQTEPENKPADKPKTEPKPVKNPTTDDRPPVQPKQPKPKAQSGNQTTVDAGFFDPANLGEVPKLTTKYALIISNSQSAIPGVAPSWAANDAALLKETLVGVAGYVEENIVVVSDATASEILTAAQSLAERVPEGGKVLLYFTGVGANLDGRDYLAGRDTASTTDASTMVPKLGLYQVFMSRGAEIFAFFQVSRPLLNGRYFGQEVPQVGAIAQMNATIPGASVQSVTRNGREVGMFTNAFSLVLNEFRSNRIPIMEFAWQLFDRIKRGSSGSASGGATQVPTLPTLTTIAQDARF